MLYLAGALLMLAGLSSIGVPDSPPLWASMAVFGAGFIMFMLERYLRWRDGD